MRGGEGVIAITAIAIGDRSGPIEIIGIAILRLVNQLAIIGIAIRLPTG